MGKYKLNCYGWSMEALGKSLTNEEVSKVEELMKENGSEFLWEVRSELEDLFDIWDGDLVHISKPLDNDTMHFDIVDEDGEEVSRFNIDEFGDLDEEYYNNNDFVEYDTTPNGETIQNVYLSIDENKGGIYYMEFDSDEVPTPQDFTYTTGSILTPEGDWDFIDKIFFKGEELEITDWLDNSGKASTVEIYTHDERVIS